MSTHTFKAGDAVDIVRLGSAWPGRYPARVVGVYTASAYIVEWENGSPFPNDTWPCRVFVKGCVEARQKEVVA